MTEDQRPFDYAAPGDDAPAAPDPRVRPDRDPFWGYSDLGLLIGLGVPGMAVVASLASLVMGRLTSLRAAQLLPAQFLGYAVVFAVMYFIFRVHYGRPFLESLAWKPSGQPVARVMISGVVLAFTIAIISALLRTPDTATPMKELLSDRVSVMLVAAFGVTLGPLCEELLFRGFLQPLLVRSLGVVAGITATAVPFGLLHLQQYAFSWRHALFITLAGAAFGWMRHRTGSTRASTLMHAAYNGLFFLALFAQRREFPHPW